MPSVRKTRKALQNGGSEPLDGGGTLTKPPPEKKLRFHILAVPHTVTRKDYSACAYTQKALKFGKMMMEWMREVMAKAD